jgi:putative SOS response-associated peptidase YedK
MCGRFTARFTWKELHALYRAFLGDTEATGGVEPWSGGVNISPTTMIPVLRFLDGKRRVDLMRWGLVPSWCKEIGNFATFNARADGVMEKAAFRGAWNAGRRCIIPAESFFEWRKADKQPFCIALGNRQPMAFAGLWEEWKQPNGQPLLSCTMITTEANSLVASLHDRMPVILGDEDHVAWLGEEPASQEQLAAMLSPFAPERMKLWPVSKAVGSVKNTGPELVEQVDLPHLL